MIVDNEDRLEEPQKMDIKWKPNKLAWDPNARVTVSLWGYRESTDVYPSLTYIDTLLDPGSLRLGQVKTTLDMSLYKDRRNPDTVSIQFGFIGINLTDATILGKDVSNRHLMKNDFTYKILHN